MVAWTVLKTMKPIMIVVRYDDGEDQTTPKGKESEAWKAP